LSSASLKAKVSGSPSRHTHATFSINSIRFVPWAGATFRGCPIVRNQTDSTWLLICTGSTRTFQEVPCTFIAVVIHHCSDGFCETAELQAASQISRILNQTATAGGKRRQG